MCTNNVTSNPTGRSYLPYTQAQPFTLHHTCKKKKHHAPQRRRGEAHCAPDIHRIAQHVKRESLNTVVHQYTEIIAEERARDPERPRRAHDERLPRDEERCGHERVERCGKQRYARLLEERAAVSAGRG